MIDHRTMKPVAEGRARTYSVLSALYSAPPSKALADMIREGGLVDDGGSLGAAANDLTASFQAAAAMETFDSEMIAEHTGLFALPSGIHPYESFYLDEKKRLGGRVTIGVSRYYQNAGAEITKTCLDLPDHIGVELEFMKFLCDIEAVLWEEPHSSGLRKCLGFQEGFLTDHLLRWYGPLCDQVVQRSKLEVYRALARLTREFLDAEREVVPELTREIASERTTPCMSEA